jgi:hypothetical protein
MTPPPYAVMWNQRALFACLGRLIWANLEDIGYGD